MIWFCIVNYNYNNNTVNTFLFPDMLLTGWESNITEMQWNSVIVTMRACVLNEAF